MQLSGEVLDHIFSFLVSHKDTLIACLKDPALSPSAERHFYRHIAVLFCRPIQNDFGGEATPVDFFQPHHLSKLVSEKPHILSYVQILTIRVGTHPHAIGQEDHVQVARDLNEFATTLLMFPALKCIMLTTDLNWSEADMFRAALEDRINLPTIKEVHLAGRQILPLSSLDSCKNIKNLSLLHGPIQVDGKPCISTLPKLRSLTLSPPFDSPPLLAWLKLHITELRFLSLKCDRSSVEAELLQVCSETLYELDINLLNSRFYSEYISARGLKREIKTNPWPKISPIHPNLQQLTIRTAVLQIPEHDGTPNALVVSWLPAAAKIITPFISSLRHLVIDIFLHIYIPFLVINDIDLSPLAILGAVSPPIPRIDLYVHTGTLLPARTRSELLSKLEDYKDIMRLIKENVLVIHSEEEAPDGY